MDLFNLIKWSIIETIVPVLNKSHTHDDFRDYQREHMPKYLEEHFLLKDQLDNAKPKETATVIEEHKYHYTNEPYVKYGQNYAGTKKLINNAKHQRYQYYPFPREEKVIKAIEGSDTSFLTSVQDYDNYSHIEYEHPQSNYQYSKQESQNMKQTPTAFELDNYYKHNYIMDYQKYLSTSDTPPDWNESYKDYPQAKILNGNSNVMDDQLNIKGNPQAVETYNGYDSYTAAHVQGLGSGGYRYRMPLLNEKF